MARQFNVAIVGCGGVSEMHFEGYLRHPDRVRIAAVCDRDFERAQRAAAKYDVPAAFGSVESMAAGAEWEVAVVCTPTPVRDELVSVLAAAGKHLFVEKPLADSYRSALKMVEACEDAGVKLAVDQNFRYHYPFDLARSLVAEGRIGNVFGIMHADLFFRQDSGWRTECEHHALAVMGIHWLDGFRWLLDSSPESLSCGTHRSPLIICSGETDASVQITFENSAVVSYVQSFSSPITRTETLIIGEQGLLTLNYSGAALHTRAGGREPVELWGNPYAGQNKPESAYAGLNELLDALEGDKEPPNSGRDNLMTVGLLDAAYRSAAEQRSVAFAAGKPV